MEISGQATRQELGSLFTQALSTFCCAPPDQATATRDKRVSTHCSQMCIKGRNSLERERSCPWTLPLSPRPRLLQDAPPRPPAHLSWGEASRESKLLGLWEESVAGRRGTRILKTGNVWRAVTKPYCRSGTEPYAEDRLSHQDWGATSVKFS